SASAWDGGRARSSRCGTPASRFTGAPRPSDTSGGAMPASPGKKPTRPRHSAKRSAPDGSARTIGEGRKVDSKRSDVKDLSLADKGRTRILWADAQMPVLRSI